jgi:hypothetical protein
MANVERPNDTAAWRALAAHYEQIKDVHLRKLFAASSRLLAISFRESPHRIAAPYGATGLIILPCQELCYEQRAYC